MAEATAPQVTIENYVRAETDFQFGGYIGKLDCFGRLVHYRAPYDVHNQVTVSGNRDTLYSVGVFDLTAPLTVQLPDSGDRYQSLMIVSQDHSIEVAYGPAEVALTAESVQPVHSQAKPLDRAVFVAAGSKPMATPCEQVKLGIYSMLFQGLCVERGLAEVADIVVVGMYQEGRRCIAVYALEQGLLCNFFGGHGPVVEGFFKPVLISPDQAADSVNQDREVGVECGIRGAVDTNTGSQMAAGGEAHDPEQGCFETQFLLALA